MIKKLIRRLLGRAPAAAAAPPAAQAAEPAEAPEAAIATAPAEPAARPAPAAAQEARPPRGRRPARSEPAPPQPSAEVLAADRPGIPLGRRVEVPASVHGIDPNLVDERAAKVVATLKQAGHEAYIVGGAVRDLLVGRRPKDFDVATDATPEQVKALFRRAFIIGRRFRIVHVVHGRGREHEVIEVSTFRAYLDAAEATQVQGNERTAKADLAGQAHAVDASGRVLRDNVWGPQIEDAARRDFTVNAMYYDPQTRTVVDYHGGLADVRAKVLRLIGDPATRYREDPVRILRAVRFAAKLGFTLEPATRAPIDETKGQLADVPISRMFDEMIKLLQTGHALASVEQLKALGLDRGIFPVLDAVFDAQRATEASLDFVRRALADTDRRVAEDKPVAPSFLLAALLWHDVRAGWQERLAAREPVVPALQQAIDAVFDARIGDVSGRGKLGTDMREIWMMQPRFERRSPGSARTLIEQPRFRAGFDFLRLRADAGELPGELAEWWEDFSLGSEDDREAMLQQLREQPREAGAARPAGRSRRGRGRAAGGAEGEAVDAGGAADGDAAGEAPAAAGPDGAAGPGPDRDHDRDAEEAEEADEPDEASAAPATAPRKRRRRRRKPGGGGGGGGAGEGGGGDREGDGAPAVARPPPANPIGD